MLVLAFEGLPATLFTTKCLPEYHSNQFKMVSVTQRTSTENKNEVDYRGSYMQITLVGFSLFVLVVLVLIMILYGSKSYKNKKKNSCCRIDKTGLSINSGALSSSITHMKISNSFATNTDSDSSEDVLYESNPRFCANNYVIDRVQPKRCPLRQQSVSSIESDGESAPSIVLSVVNDGDKSLLSLIKAKNLRRSGNGQNDKLVPEGVFARIYPSNATSSEESEHKKSEPFYETSFIKSKKSKLIKFGQNDSFVINSSQFPIRISLYEMDKNKTRFSIGHSFLYLNTRDNYQTNQMIELNLFATIHKAQNANKFK